MIGFSEVLLQRRFGELNDRQDEYLRDILASGRHLLELLNDVLDLSKVEAGKMELERSRFPVGPALEQLKADPSTAGIPVVVATVLDERARARPSARPSTS